MSKNKGLQFIVGCLVIASAWKAYDLGLFGLLASSDDGQVESVDIVGLLGTALISAIQLCGYVALLLIGGLMPLAERVVDYIATLMPRLKRDDATNEGDVDSDKLNEVLTTIVDRLDKLEVKSND